MPENEEVRQKEELKGLADPYANSTFSPNFRLNVAVMTDDILVIQSVAPSRGTKQYLIASYVKSLADELRSKGITSYSIENLETFRQIVERRNQFTDIGHPDTRIVRPDTRPNVPRRKGGVRQRNKNLAEQRTGTPGKTHEGEQGWED